MCPLIILLLGIPQKGMSSSSKMSESGGNDEPIGEGQIDFALAPSVITNPHTWRALYQLVVTFNQPLQQRNGFSELLTN